jgi:hypothetical protein
MQRRTPFFTFADAQKINKLRRQLPVAAAKEAAQKAARQPRRKLRLRRMKDQNRSMRGTSRS